MYSLHHPPANLTLIHWLLWPLIAAQLAALKNWVRRTYGYGVPYGYHVSRWGRVTLRHVGAQPLTSDSAAPAFAAARFDFTLGLSRVAALPPAAGRVAPLRLLAMVLDHCGAVTPHTDTS
ncbi:MAG: hypothetical protein IPK75_03675 [Acidobacteria bacterium]|jgi:hypothetical protein|nr:hypothetical protein [Acidobacteriota bacterium]